MRHAFICICALSLCAAAAAQAPTGTLTGTVVDSNRHELAGVTISVTSPHLQGTRRAVSGATGGYILALLPPGDYRVKIELAGYQTVELPAKLNGAQTTNLEIELRPPGAAATVSGAVETISTTAPVATTGEARLVEALPSGRDLAAFTVETPGVVEEANGNVSIAGGQATETAYLVDGVTASDPVGRSLIPFYVEDGIEEATVQVSRISAEYGRFTGGIVNALTKSGGNEFHGSARALLTSESWSAPTPKTLARADQINKQYEATLGGRILTDRLWFFAALRSYDTAGTAYIFDTNLAPAQTLPTTTDERRYEGKLTFSPTPEHRLAATYVSRERDSTNYVFPAYPVYDTASFYDRQIPQDLLALHYSGVLTDAFFLEGQYSRAHTTFKNSGSRFTDLVKGTPVWDNTAGAVYNSPIFCAVCTNGGDDRITTEVLLKGSLFLTSRALGTHDLRFGANAFDGTDLVNNWQSGSGYNLDASAVLQNGSTFYPVMDPNEMFSYIEWWPIFNLAQRFHLKTYSLFANDVWRPSPHLTLSLGARWDKPDVTDASGAKVPTDSKISPRVSATWDPKGDGDWQLNLGYAAYVASISSIANAQSTAGQLAYYNIQYGGPAINTECDPEHPTASTCHDTAQVLQMVFDWLRSLPGADGDLQKAFLANPQLWGPGPPGVPGYQTFIGPDLRPPSVNEWSLGVVKKLANRGVARLDYIDRTWRDFYSSRVDTTTGTSTDPYGNRYDREIIENTNSGLERVYRGLLLQGQYRVSDALMLGADYTWSQTLSKGTPAHYYPEYWQPSWNNPERDIRRHRGSVYGTYTAFDSRYHRLSAGLAFRYVSGNQYTAAGSVLVAPYVDATNLPYVNPPTSVEYFFQAPGTYHTDAITTTDLALSYSFKIPGLRGLEFRIDPQVTNVFNNQAVTAVNMAVYTRANGTSRGLSAFNPFTTAPKECPQGSTRAQCSALGANWMKGPLFGKPTSPGSYQEPRTVSVYVGVRF